MTHISGDQHVIRMATKERSHILPGFLVYRLDERQTSKTITAQPASARPWYIMQPSGCRASEHNCLATLRMFLRDFLGVAMEESVRGDAGPISVAQAGVFTFSTFALTGDATPAGTPYRPAMIVGSFPRLANEIVTPAPDTKHAVGVSRTVDADTIYLDITDFTLLGRGEAV